RPSRRCEGVIVGVKVIPLAEEQRVGEPVRDAGDRHLREAGGGRASVEKDPVGRYRRERMRLRTGVAAITGDPIPLIRRAVLDRVLRDDIGGAQQTAQDRGRPRGAAIEVVEAVAEVPTVVEGLLFYEGEHVHEQGEAGGGLVVSFIWPGGKTPCVDS